MEEHFLQHLFALSKLDQIKGAEILQNGVKMSFGYLRLVPSANLFNLFHFI